MDNTIVHFEIPADQPERAAKFYRDLFGWKIDRYEGSDIGMDYWMVETVPTDGEGKPVRQGVNGGLMKRMYEQQPPVNYIGVASVDEFLGKAERLGAKVMMGKHPVPGMGWFAQLTDPEGNLFAIWENDPSAAPVAAAAGERAGKSGG